MLAKGQEYYRVIEDQIYIECANGRDDHPEHGEIFENMKDAYTFLGRKYPDFGDLRKLFPNTDIGIVNKAWESAQQVKYRFDKIGYAKIYIEIASHIEDLADARYFE